jgi:hypothetical protein
MIQTEAMLAAKWQLIDAIRAHAKFAADFECTAGNYDRPIADTPWLASHRYGDGVYDARWYAVHGALSHFVEGLPGAVDDALRVFASVAFMAGMEE